VYAVQLYQDSSYSPECHHSPGILQGKETGATYCLNCKRWNCEHCRWILYNRFRSRIAGIHYNWMMVLTSPFTLDERGKLDREQIKFLNQCCRRFRNRIRERVCEIEDWTWVCEVGPDGHKLHIHLLLKLAVKRIPYRVLHDIADRVGLPRWRRFERGDYSDYACKYLTKDIMQAVWPKYAHRCGTSAPAPVFQILRHGTNSGCALKSCAIKFEPLRFVPMRDLEEVEYNFEERTGALYAQYAGPSYVPSVSGGAADLYLISNRLSAEWDINWVGGFG